MDSYENLLCCLLEHAGTENLLQKTKGELALIRSSVILVPEYKLASLFPLCFTFRFLHLFILLPGNLQLGLSHSDANQTRIGVQPAVVAAAARVVISIQRAGCLVQEQQGRDSSNQRMRLGVLLSITHGVWPNKIYSPKVLCKWLKDIISGG